MAEKCEIRWQRSQIMYALNESSYHHEERFHWLLRASLTAIILGRIRCGVHADVELLKACAAAENAVLVHQEIVSSAPKLKDRLYSTLLQAALVLARKMFLTHRLTE